MIGLKHVRIDRRLTQHQLAFLTGIPQPVISLIEIGKWQPSDAQLEELARALEVPALELLKEVTIIPRRDGVAAS